MTLTLRRHDLLRVQPACWPGILARELEREPASDTPHTATREAYSQTLEEWVSYGWPVMVRRLQPHDGIASIPVAVPMPPLGAARRTGIALTLREREIAGRVAPLPLGAGLLQAPAAWQDMMRTLMQLSEDVRSRALLYGSLLWQSITGRSYLTASSDIDIGWPVASERQARSLVTTLSGLDRTSPMRLDGELLLPDGAGVSWREFAGGSADLLVKTMHGTELRTRERLFPDATSASVHA